MEAESKDGVFTPTTGKSHASLMALSLNVVVKAATWTFQGQFEGPTELAQQ